jgi:hypothetical protein
VDHVTLQKVVKQTVLHQVGPVAEKLFPKECLDVFPHVPRMLCEHEAEGGVFAVPSHLNIAVFESLICTGIMDVQANHGASVVLLAELKHHVLGHDGDALRVAEWHTSWCPQTIQRGKLLKPPGGQVQPCFGNDSLT